MSNFFYETKHGVSEDYFALFPYPNPNYPLHFHRCYEIIYLLEGAMTVMIDHVSYTISSGNMIMIKPNSVHSIQSTEGGDAIFCMFAPEQISAISESILKYHLVSPIVHQVPSPFRDLFGCVTSDSDIGKVKCLLYGLSSLFYEQLDTTKEDQGGSKRNLLRDVIRYVEKNMDKPCSIQDLARSLGYSVTHLSRYFATNVGMTYSDYVKEIKIRQACYLLRKSYDPISTIAKQCGFESSSTFNRCFKQVTGCSPTEYRSKHGRI